MTELLMDPAVWASLLTLTLLEIVLGIDNIIFIIVLADRVEPEKQAMTRRIGIIMAVVSRLLLLSSIAFIASLTTPVITLSWFDLALSWRDIILLAGGLFLIAKATHEIHHKLEDEPDTLQSKGKANLTSIIIQVMILDLVFSLDSVITAVGIAEHLPVMIAAVLIATLVMLLAANPLSRFIKNHPTLTMLAFSFLLLIGMALVADGLHFHIEKGYIYAAIGFSLFVEMLNLAARRVRGKK